VAPFICLTHFVKKMRVVNPSDRLSKSSVCFRLQTTQACRVFFAFDPICKTMTPPRQEGSGLDVVHPRRWFDREKLKKTMRVQIFIHQTSSASALTALLPKQTQHCAAQCPRRWFCTKPQMSHNHATGHGPCCTHNCIHRPTNLRKGYMAKVMQAAKP